MSSGRFDARAYLRRLTGQPGVYRMYDADGELLYVGKARNLKRRVSSYFLRNSNDPRIAAMVDQVARIEVTVARSEDEALLLEANLIKQESPRYNIMYRDDKSYPYLRITGNHRYPRIAFYRGAPRKPHEDHGPYPSAQAVRQTIVSLQKLFRLRPCSDSYFSNRSRPCLQHQIGRCSAPCVGLIDAADYAEDLSRARRVLEGRGDAVVGELNREMETASGRLDFERAAALRDRIAALRRLQEARAVRGRRQDLDLVAVEREGDRACLVISSVRGGRNLGHRAHHPRHPPGTRTGALVEAFLAQHYLGQSPPPDIVVSDLPDDADWLQQALSARAGRQVKITAAPRGERRQLLTLASATARQALNARTAGSARLERQFQSLAEALDLDPGLARIECIDISHTRGEATVASCVVFDRDGPRKSDYRRYNIRSTGGGDDYGAIRETVQRRFRQAGTSDAALPDLMLIDGGAGQLGAACEALASTGLPESMLLGVSKGSGRRPGLEQLHRVDAEPMRLDPASPALHLIQQVRDEAHRFAITGHRGQRAKRRTRSTLEDIAGLGAVRRRALLSHFGGIRQLRRASIEDLQRVDGISRSLAERVFAVLHG